MLLSFPKNGHEPTNGSPYSGGMPKSGKKPAADRRWSDAADIVARNVATLFQYAKAHHDPDRSTAVLFEDYVRRQRWGDTVGKSTIYRMRNGDPGIAIGVIDIVARAFGLQAWQLLYPDLDPAKLPVLITTEAEKLFADFKELQRRLRSAPDLEETEGVEGAGEDSSNARDYAGTKSGKENSDRKRFERRRSAVVANGRQRRKGGDD